MAFSKKTTYILGGIVLVLGLGGIVMATRTPSTPAMSLVRAQRGALVQTVDGTGEVTALQDVVTSFGTSGKLGILSVSVGDLVNAGDILAILDVPALEADLARAIALLEKEYAGPSSEQLLVQDAALASAQAAYDLASADLSAKQAEVARVTALAASDTATAALRAEEAADEETRGIAEQDLLLRQAQEDLRTALAGGIVAIRSGMNDSDLVLGRQNSLENDACEYVFGLKNKQTITNADTKYDIADVARDSAEDLVYALSSTSTQEELESAYTAVQGSLHATQDLLQAVSEILEATASDSTSCSVEDVRALKTTIAAGQTTLQQETSSLEGVSHAYETTQKTTASTKASLAYARETAVQELVSAQVRESQSVTSAQVAVTLAQSTLAARLADLSREKATYAELTATPRTVDIAALEADKAQAEARLDDATIRAPFSGVVTDIEPEVGERVNASEDVITLHADSASFSIPVDIAESDIAKIAVGNSAVVTFDAFGDDRVFEGSVQRIDPAEHVIEGVVFYTAEVFLEEGQDVTGIRSGMSSDVVIETRKIEDTVSLPQRAVLERDGKKYVRIPRENATDKEASFEERAVVVGMRGDDGMIEILEGLSGGEEVILSLN